MRGALDAVNVPLASYARLALGNLYKKSELSGFLQSRVLRMDHLKGGRMRRDRLEGFVYLAAFTGSIPIANWMIGNVGTACVPNGPCIVPVAPGLVAPSGVLMIGLALVLRDL